MKCLYKWWLASGSAILISLAIPGATAQNIAPANEYVRVADRLKARILKEMNDKKLPALSIALVDDRSTVWAQGFGFEDAQKKLTASAHTVYRVGSVSQLLTDLAIMQLVERGQLDLDAPVTRYLPAFAPRNPFNGQITLRQLISHRSGLVREPPIGNYVDTSLPDLGATVESLNKTSLVFAPGTHYKYSNAGIATAGYVLQEVVHKPYQQWLQSVVLEPLGMQDSSFTPDAAIMQHLAAGEMWSYDGLRFQAPSFQLGEGPASSMYSTVTDLGKLISELVVGRKVVTLGMLQSMWTPQFSGHDGERFGLGVQLGELDGEWTVGYAGEIYGFETWLEILPDAKLGVVVCASKDGVSAVTRKIAGDALRLMLAEQRHALPSLSPPTHEVLAAQSRSLAGDYQAGASRIRLEDQGGTPYLRGMNGGPLIKLKSSNRGELIEDSSVAFSEDPILTRQDGKGLTQLISVDRKEYKRVKADEPGSLSEQSKSLIGEYGWDFDKLYVLEDEGALNILVNWFEFEPLELIKGDVYRLPDNGHYAGEEVHFVRDADGSVSALRLGEILFPRRPEAAEGAVFQITPLKPVEELRREAIAALPPVEKGNFKKPDLIELTSLDPTIKLDIRYASSRNFLGSPLYLRAQAFMQKPAAEAVARVSRRLHAIGYGLLIHDAYRPWYVTKMFWEGTPDDKKIFVADPSQGSRHNRGCAVDLTLYDLKTGLPIQMTGGYDEMSERSYPFYPGGTSLQRFHRDRLRVAMEAEGFAVYEYEWWHFDYKEWPKYPILNISFEQLDQAGRVSSVNQETR